MYIQNMKTGIYNSNTQTQKLNKYCINKGSNDSKVTNKQKSNERMDGEQTHLFSMFFVVAVVVVWVFFFFFFFCHLFVCLG